MHRSISIFAAIASAVIAASPALAGDLRETRSIVVTVSPADFASAKSRSALDRRLQSAVEDMCGVNAAAEGVDWGEIKRCRAEARRNWDHEIAALAEGRTVRLSAR